MATRAKATIRLEFTSQKQLTTLINALSPEVKAQVTRRSKIKIEKDGIFLILTVEAEDTVAMRATLNAYLRWINSTINVIHVIEEA